MNWQQACEDPLLKDLPFKIELNEYGQVVMSPASNEHGFFQMRIGTLIHLHVSGGRVLSECSIETPRGVKVADVAWLSQSFLDKYGFQTPYPKAPEICVEIFSPSNSDKEIHDKVQLYLEQGATEVWICDSFGNLDFYTISGETSLSVIVPDFPAHI